MRIETVGLMTPGDMGQALAVQIQAKGFDRVYRAGSAQRAQPRTRARSRA